VGMPQPWAPRDRAGKTEDSRSANGVWRRGMPLPRSTAPEQVRRDDPDSSARCLTYHTVQQSRASLHIALLDRIRCP
jgi:hypothetical protein